MIYFRIPGTFIHNFFVSHLTSEYNYKYFENPELFRTSLF